MLSKKLAWKKSAPGSKSLAEDVKGEEENNTFRLELEPQSSPLLKALEGMSKLFLNTDFFDDTDDADDDDGDGDDDTMDCGCNQISGIDGRVLKDTENRFGDFDNRKSNQHDDMGQIQEDELKIIKMVKFKPTTKVVLIPSLNEYHKAHLENDLWWSKKDFHSFRKDAGNEMRSCISRYGLNASDAVKFLYQPSNILPVGARTKCNVSDIGTSLIGRAIFVNPSLCDSANPKWSTEIRRPLQNKACPSKAEFEEYTYFEPSSSKEFFFETFVNDLSSTSSFECRTKVDDHFFDSCNITSELFNFDDELGIEFPDSIERAMSCEFSKYLIVVTEKTYPHRIVHANQTWIDFCRFEKDEEIIGYV